MLPPAVTLPLLIIHAPPTMNELTIRATIKEKLDEIDHSLVRIHFDTKLLVMLRVLSFNGIWCWRAESDTLSI
jgi:hypothetical protein